MIDQFYEIITRYSVEKAYGGYFLLWIFSLVYLLYKRKKNTGGFDMLGIPTYIASLLIFNPLCALIIDKCLQGSFWRVFWVFNIVIVVAYVGVDIISSMREEKKKTITTLLILIIFSSVGNGMYSDKNFRKAENVYKIPNQIIEVCEILQENGINKKVAVELNMVEWVRQYDATIETLYGRELGGSVAWGLILNDADAFAWGLEVEKCNCVVLVKNRGWADVMSERGYKKLAETAAYDIWKVR